MVTYAGVFFYTIFYHDLFNDVMTRFCGGKSPALWRIRKATCPVRLIQWATRRSVDPCVPRNRRRVRRAGQPTVGQLVVSLAPTNPPHSRCVSHETAIL